MKAGRDQLSPRELELVRVLTDQLCRAMGLPVGAISVKATTEEGLGFTGGELGIAAHGVVLLEALPG